MGEHFESPRADNNAVQESPFHSELIEDRKQSSKTDGDKDIAWKQTVCEFGAALTAGTVGLTCFALTKNAGISSRLALTAAGGAATRYYSKGALELGLLKPEDRTLSLNDLGWGAVDGLSGVAALAAEARVANGVSRILGKRYVQAPLMSKEALVAGEAVLEEQAGCRFLRDIARGATGGSAGSAAWATFHSPAENREVIMKDPIAGAGKCASDIMLSGIVGGLVGFGVGGAISGVTNNLPLAKSFHAKVAGDKGVTRVSIAHINDNHSTLFGPNGLSRVSTMLDRFKIWAKDRGIAFHSFSAGDESSGNAVSSFSPAGPVENHINSKMGLTGTIPGNHAAEIAGGKKDIPLWLEFMGENNMHKLAANVDIEVEGNEKLTRMFSKLFKDRFKPYRIEEVGKPNGEVEKIGYIALVTDDITSGKTRLAASKARALTSGLRADELEAKIGFMYLDHEDVARRMIEELKQKGVNKIVVLSHLGLETDKALARKVPGISAIIGGHSHDQTPVPVWIFNNMSGNEVPIVQAGCKGRFVGKLDLAFKKSGAVDRYRSSGRLHRISEEIPEKKEIIQAIRNTDAIQAENKMKEQTGLTLSSPLRFGDETVRCRETELGNIISDALLSGVNQSRAAFNRILFMLKHSGDIRSGLPGRKLSIYDLENVFCNGNNRGELVAVTQPGKYIQRQLEFGVADLPAPKRADVLPRILQRLPEGPKSLLVRSTEKIRSSDFGQWLWPQKLQEVDHSGNFLQVSGLRYKIDLSRPAWERVRSVEIEVSPGKFEELDPNKRYTGLTLLHPLEKWGKKVFKGESVFGKTIEIPEFPINPTTGEPVAGAKLTVPVRQLADGTTETITIEMLGKSQPEILEQYLRQNACKHGVVEPCKLGPVSGRIKDTSPKLWERDVPSPGPGTVTHTGMQSFRRAFPEPFPNVAKNGSNENPDRQVI